MQLVSYLAKIWVYSEFLLRALFVHQVIESKDKYLKKVDTNATEDASICLFQYDSNKHCSS